jgi:hypothetical protein
MQARTWLSRRPIVMAVVAVVVAGSVARAQGVPVRKQPAKVPVRKQSGGEVALDSAARADSIARAEAAQREALARAEMARQDSIARVDFARRDSIARAEALEAQRRDSMARADSINAARAAAAQVKVPPALARRGFYFGIGGGWSSPSGDYGDPYKSGWNVTVPFGFQTATSRWGFRGDIAYDAHGGKNITRDVVPPVIAVPISTTVPTQFDVDGGSIWSGNFDVTVDVLQWGKNKLSALYLLGGGGVHFFDKPKFTATPTTGTGAGVTTSYEGDSQTKFGLNGGAGLAFGVGRAALFVESRYFTAYTDNTNAEWVPIVLGLRWH